jgi:hypothetical protein
MAATLIALVGSAASGKSDQPKKYTAISLSTSAVLTSSGDATSKQGAKNKAWRHCDDAASQDSPNIYEGDCEIGLWVKNGWAAVAFESTLEGPPYQPSWGVGYGKSRSEARYWAVYYCEQGANESCTIDRTERTRYFNPSLPTRAGR